MTKLIEEVYGIDTNTFNRDTVTIRQNPLDETPGFGNRGFDGTRSGLHTPIYVSPPNPAAPSYLTSKLATGWQKELYNRTLNYQDTIIAVPPAAGKTGPVLNAWFTMLEKAIQRGGLSFTSPEFPRILYIAKTKQLATENRIQNFIGDKDTGLFKLVSKYPTYFPKLGITDSNAELTNEQIQKIYQLINGMVGFLTGGISVSSVKSAEYTIKPIIISTPMENENSGIVSLLKQYRNYFNIIVIDEFQQYIPRPNQNFDTKTIFTPDIEKDFELISGLIKNSLKAGKCGIQIMTGTVNKNTLEEFRIVSNKHFNRDFKLICEFDPARHIIDTNTNKLIKNPEFTANRSSVKVMPYEKMSSRSEIVNLITRIVKGRQTNSIIVIFSVRRGAGMGIFGLVEDLLSKLPIRFQGFQTPDFIGPKPNIGNKALSGRKIDNDIPANNYFGKPGRNTSLNDLVNIHSGNYISPEYQPNLEPEGLKTEPVSDIEYLKYFDVEKGENRNIKGEHNISYEGNILYQGVLRGVGIMTGTLPDRMKITIQKLFRDGKIYVILATDSLGIGANVLAQHIYIPNLEKVDGSTFGPIDTSSLIQLVNRAGRTPSKIPYANIYCRLKDFNRVEEIFKGDPATQTEELSFEEIRKKIHNDNDYLKFLWGRIIGQ